MKPLAEVTWRLAGDATCAAIAAALSAHFDVEWRNGASSITTCFDNADAALWHAGYLLLAGGDGRVCLTRGGAPAADAEVTGDARFWWDFPEGLLRDTLRPLIGERALRPVAVHEIEERELVVFNADRKIVVRAGLTCSTVDGHSMQYLTFKPMRGYDAELSAASRCLASLLVAQADLDRRALLAAHRIAAFAPRVAVAMPVTADMPTEQAVRIMGHVMLEQAQQHVHGVVEDIDTEFLHAFRVGLRKTRSLIVLLKKALPAATLDKLKPRLSAMAGKTNRLRDLDVYLLAQHEYVALLPADFEAGMAELTALVRTRRAQAQREVAAYFTSPAFQGDVDACLAELSLRPSLATPAAAKPVLPLVKRQMLKRYATLQALRGQLHHASADDDIHALRIEFKKLRYLIEFFLDLLPKKRTQKLLADLKKIQAVLGDFNDLSVQIEFLNGFRDPRRAAMAKAVDGLSAILHVKKLATRERIFDALDNYFTENRAIEFDLVFGTRHRKDAA